MFKPRNGRSRLGRNKRTPEQQDRHREIMRVFTGLLLALFVAMMSGTIVGNTLPVIIADLGGDQRQYTWIVTATLLASTASTPIFGKLADLFDKKKLLLFAVGLFAFGSLLAGFATSPNALIGYRALQGVGMGAQMALVQTTIASIISPRERGRYNGYMGAVMAVATVSGPLIGGLIVDTPWLGWRWSFWVGVPFSLFAIVVLARRLVVPASSRRKPKIDYWGSALIVAAVTVLLLWLSFAGDQFAWVSWQSAAMVGGAVIGTVVFVLVELRVPEPVVPMWILTERTTALSIVASFSVGTVMFGAPVFLGQYFQIGRGYGPAESGLLMTPLMFGVFIASTVAGRMVSNRGTWKRYVVGGVALQATGALLMATIGATTPLWLIGIFLALMGLGQGASMQNLVLAVQNTVRLENMGAASSAVAFFRTLGGASGVQVLGAALSAYIATLTTTRLAEAGIDQQVLETGEGELDVAALPGAAEEIVRSAYGDGMSLIFLIMGGMSIIALIAVSAMRNSLLRDTVDMDVKRVLEKDGDQPSDEDQPSGESQPRAEHQPSGESPPRGEGQPQGEDQAGDDAEWDRPPS